MDPVIGGQTAVTVALIASGGTVLASVISGMAVWLAREARSGAREVRDTVRQVNVELQGNGTGVPHSQSLKMIRSMLEDALAGQGRIEERLRAHTEDRAAHR